MDIWQFARVRGAASKTQREGRILTQTVPAKLVPSYLINP